MNAVMFGWWVLVQAQSQLEVAAEDAIEYLRRRREVEEDGDWEWAGGELGAGRQGAGGGRMEWAGGD